MKNVPRSRAPGPLIATGAPAGRFMLTAEVVAVAWKQHRQQAFSRNRKTDETHAPGVLWWGGSVERAGTSSQRALVTPPEGFYHRRTAFCAQPASGVAPGYRRGCQRHR